MQEKYTNVIFTLKKKQWSEWNIEIIASFRTAIDQYGNFRFWGWSQNK